MHHCKSILLIPAFNPDESLIELIENWRTAYKQDNLVLVINDGSDVAYNNIFTQLEEDFDCVVIKHAKNKGKGAALKTGFNYITRYMASVPGCITADADGQHDIKDILKISACLERKPGYIYLGVRDFSQPNVPKKSYYGNRISSFLFHTFTGVRCQDTQTGLRGIPQAFLSQMTQIKGEHYEFEMNMLFYLAKNNIPMEQIPIQTIYKNNNAGSHFNPIVDSFRIYSEFFKFIASSLAGSLVDMGLFFAFMGLFNSVNTGILISTVLARMGSASVNFTLNKLWVFRSHGSVQDQGIRYAFLFIVQMLLSAIGTHVIAYILPVLAAKIITDSLLFFGSYFVQISFVFKNPAPQVTLE